MMLAVVIPAYNEAATIESVAVGAASRARWVFVVDDGSTDCTRELAATLPVTLVEHSVNLGKAASLWSGFQAALAVGADAILTLDGDGQHRTEDIPRFVRAHMLDPRSVVVGARMRRAERGPRARRFANRFADFWVSWAAGHRVLDSQSGMRLYPADLLREIDLRHDPSRAFTLESELLIEAAARGYRTIAVLIDAIYGSSPRPSHFRATRDIRRIVFMIAGRLLRRGLYPVGLYRSLRYPSRVMEPEPMSTGSARSVGSSDDARSV